MNERALLDAIIANPDDDDVRLVYADALESAGNPLGEFIQLQCRLARGFDLALSQRASELAMAHGRTWLADLLALKLGAQFSYDRGFVHTMTAPFPSATTRATELLARAPLLAKLELTVHGQADRMQLAQPKSDLVLARAESLFIRGRHRGNTRAMRGPIADLSGLAVCPFTRLRALRLEALRTKPNNLFDFLQSPNVATLETLIMRLRMPIAETPRVLAGIGASVRNLDLATNTLDAAGIRAFLATNRDRLETLVLDQTSLPEAAIELIQATPLPELRTISLRYLRLRERVQELARWNAPKLESVVV